MINSKHQTKITIIRNKFDAESKPQVYSCSRTPPPQFGDDSLSIQVFHRCRVHQVDCGDLIRCSWGCWEKFPFLFFFTQLLGFSFGFGPASACRSPKGICSSPRHEGVKGATDLGALVSLRPGGGKGMECRASLQWQRPVWPCTSLRCAMCSPGEVVPGSWDPGSGGLHRLLGGEVWIVTCAFTQASWWLQ